MSSQSKYEIVYNHKLTSYIKLEKNEIITKNNFLDIQVFKHKKVFMLTGKDLLYLRDLLPKNTYNMNNYKQASQRPKL